MNFIRTSQWKHCAVRQSWELNKMLIQKSWNSILARMLPMTKKYQQQQAMNHYFDINDLYS